MTIIFKASALAAAWFVASNMLANAQQFDDKLTLRVSQTVVKHDEKIEKAAKQKAAEKIGELRGSFDGFNKHSLLSVKEFRIKRSSILGFPIMEEPAQAVEVDDGVEPII